MSRLRRCPASERYLVGETPASRQVGAGLTIQRGKIAATSRGKNMQNTMELMTLAVVVPGIINQAVNESTPIRLPLDHAPPYTRPRTVPSPSRLAFTLLPYLCKHHASRPVSTPTGAIQHLSFLRVTNEPIRLRGILCNVFLLPPLKGDCNMLISLCSLQ